MKRVPNSAITSALVLEHEALGADFEEYNGMYIPASYGNVDEEEKGFLACGVADSTANLVLRISGASATSFISTMTTAPSLMVGQCATSLVLSGEGDVIDVMHIARTGAFEYMTISSTDFAEEVLDWLNEAAALERSQIRAFPNLEIEDETGKLVLLQFEGNNVAHVLADYMAKDIELPACGTISSVMFDKIPTLMMRPSESFSQDRYFVFIPVQLSAVLWRSLMSFDDLVAVGALAVRHADYKKCDGLKKHFAGIQAKPSVFGFENFIYRTEGFLGARAL